MLQYLILVVQNLLGTIILLAMIFAMEYRGIGTETPARKKALMAACGVGTLFALALAVLRRTTNLINREFWNFGVLSVAIVAAILYVAAIWRLRDGETGGSRIFNNIYRLTAVLLCASLPFYALPDIFMYPAEFVLAGESVLSTDFLFKFIGYAAGLLLVLVTGWSLFRASGHLAGRPARLLLIVGLAVNIVNQAAAILQFLYARRLIPTPRALFRVLTQIANHHDFFLYALMAITFAVPLIIWRQSLKTREDFANPAEKRKSRASARRRRRWGAVIILGYALAVLCLTAVKAYDEKEVVLSPVEPMEIIGAEIVIPAERINDGHLHRFVYTASNGTGVRFIII
ncbi:MAG: DUF2318 domain-containing protein, partial [Gracilibacteraceae bacterium]|nr:DUF2318 domain-containing protein [Gracilibacteraceae bacterium]